MLHTDEGRAFYLNRQLEPAFFDPGEVRADIDRLSRAFGEQPHLISASGDSGNNTLNGFNSNTMGDDVIKGGNGNDTLNGKGGPGLAIWRGRG
jgi:hypothetical protein